jgi:threonine aldolase
LSTLQGVATVAGEQGLNLHMDGARLMNAVVASGVPAEDFAATVDSLWLDLSKGLGCPVGAVLAGTREFIDEAWRWKHRVGGAMRQAGIIAAAGSWALANHVERLAEDHNNARQFAKRVSEIPGVHLVNEDVQTNLIFFDVSGSQWPAQDISARLREQGVWIGAIDNERMRAVTHLDVSRDDVNEAADRLADVING